MFPPSNPEVISRPLNDVRVQYCSCSEIKTGPCRKIQFSAVDSFGEFSAVDSGFPFQSMFYSAPFCLRMIQIRYKLITRGILARTNCCTRHRWWDLHPIWALARTSSTNTQLTHVRVTHLSWFEIWAHEHTVLWSDKGTGRDHWGQATLILRSSLLN
jgi:hypothetical protein